MTKKNNFKKLLAEHSDLKVFEKNKVIFNYQEKADKIYFLLKGLVRLYIKNDKQEIEIKRVKKGEFIGQTALTEAEYTSKAEVHHKSNLLVFKKSELKKIMAKNNKFAQKMINSLSRYIKRLENIDKISLQPITEIDKKAAVEKEIQKSPAAKKNQNRAVKKAAEVINSDFYLPGHQNYNKEAAEEFDYYLYPKEIECPVCSNEFKVQKIRNSRLRITEIREDLRPIYKNFKLYYYNIWSCPSCYFTAKINDFEDFSKKRRQKIDQNFKKMITDKLGRDFKINFQKPRQINTVLDAYYLAAELYNFAAVKEDKKAFLWREISWIYEDLADDQLAEKASLKALEHLKEFYFKDKSRQTKKEKDNITLLLAVLYYKHGQKDQAIPLLDDLIRDKRTNLRQKNKARDLFYKIREEKKLKKVK